MLYLILCYLQVMLVQEVSLATQELRERKEILSPADQALQEDLESQDKMVSSLWLSVVN